MTKQSLLSLARTKKIRGEYSDEQVELAAAYMRGEVSPSALCAVTGVFHTNAAVWAVARVRWAIRRGALTLAAATKPEGT